MSKKDEQIARMKGLMTYGMNNTPKKTPITESIEGADGKVYAIIREGVKYYIKSTQKGNELVSESFDYIGGFMNKKNNEFSSYNQASKHLELKMRSLNEAYGVNKSVEMLNPDKKEILMVEMTDVMKNSLARYRQIMNNAAGIMKENQTISMSNTGNPEAPKTTSFNSKLGEPFTETGKAELDKDLKATSNEQEKEGAPFGDTSKTEEYKDAKFVPKGSVANQKPTGGKVVRVNESDSLSDDLDSYEYEETMEDLEENDEQLPEPPDEITIDEDTESSYVGFADDDNSMLEASDENDIDLDDIDTDLDDDNEDEDIEIDDIDSNLDDDNEEEFENELEDEEDEIASLRAEVERLKDMINNLSDNTETEGEDETENDFELELDSDEDDTITEERSYKRMPLPFDVDYKTDNFVNKNMRFQSLLNKLKELNNEFGGNENDKKILLMIQGNCFNNHQTELELKGCEKEGWDSIDIDVWKELVERIQETTNNISHLVYNLSFVKNKNISMDEIYSKYIVPFEVVADRWEDYYYDNTNTDTATSDDKQEVESEEDLPEIEDTNYDNVGFEDDYQDEDDMDDEAWDAAAGFNDDIFDSISPRSINEDKLNTFGKHPGYRKKVMTLPATGSDENDWNDESVYSEEPFGSKKGSSEPYSNIIEKSVSSVLESLKKKIY